MIAAGDMPPVEGAAEAPADLDALTEPVPETAAEEAPVEAPVDIDAMMAAEAAPAENLDAILNAEVDALTGEEPAPESIPEMAADIPSEEPIPETPAEIPTVEPIPEDSSDMDAVMAAMAAAEAEPAEGSAEASADIDPVAAAMMAAEQEAASSGTVEITEPVAMDNEPEQTPAPMNMDAASDAMEGAVEDIEDFLSSENYEYTVVKNGDNTLIIMKTSDGGAMTITYEGNEFDALEPSFAKDGKCGYNEIMNAFVKDTIKHGGAAKIFRHKGSVVVAK
jgi:regulator of protease activity HflC (stomatin/prohibitin superfamily)